MLTAPADATFSRRDWMGQVAALSLLDLSSTQSAESYRLGVMAGMYSALPLEEAMTRIRKAGYRYISIARKHGSETVYAPELTESERASVVRRIKSCDVQPFLSLGGFAGDPQSNDGLQKYIAQLNLCTDYGIPVMVGAGPWYYKKFPNIPKRDSEWQVETSRYYAGFEKALRHAESIRVTIALKPHTGITARGKDCLAILKRFSSPYFRIAWDAGNVSYYEGVHPDPDLPDFASQVSAVCIKDHLGLRGDENFPVPGRGQIDHELMFQTLFSAGFRGPLALERLDGRDGFGNKAQPEVVDARITAAYNYLGPLLNRITSVSSASVPR
jgi:sugar phosphate isomerase/epimerase